MKQLPLPRKILVLEVPEDAKMIRINTFSGDLRYYSSGWQVVYLPLNGRFNSVGPYGELLGTWTATEGFSFDCTPFVESDNDDHWKDYLLSRATYHLSTPSDSFLSAVHAAGIVTENPLETQQAEQNVAKKLVFIEVI